MKTINLCLILFCTQITLGVAQDNNDDFKQALLKKKYERAQNISSQRNNKGDFLLNFTIDGDPHKAIFGNNGRWQETWHPIDWKDMPKAVRSVITQDYDKNQVREIYDVEHFLNQRFYRVIVGNASETMTVEIRPSGDKIN